MNESEEEGEVPETTTTAQVVVSEKEAAAEQGPLQRTTSAAVAESTAAANDEQQPSAAAAAIIDNVFKDSEDEKLEELEGEVTAKEMRDKTLQENESPRAAAKKQLEQMETLPAVETTMNDDSAVEQNEASSTMKTPPATTVEPMQVDEETSKAPTATDIPPKDEAMTEKPPEITENAALEETGESPQPMEVEETETNKLQAAKEAVKPPKITEKATLEATPQPMQVEETENKERKAPEEAEKPPKTTEDAAAESNEPQQAAEAARKPPAVTQKAASSIDPSSPAATEEKQPAVTKKQVEDTTQDEQVKQATNSSPKKAASSTEATLTSTSVHVEQGAAPSKVVGELKDEKGKEVAPNSTAALNEKSSGNKPPKTDQQVNDGAANTQPPVTNVNESEASPSKQSSPVAGVSAARKETKEPAGDEIDAEKDKGATRKTAVDALSERPATMQRAESASRRTSIAQPNWEKRTPEASGMSQDEKTKSQPKQAPPPAQEKETSSSSSSKTTPNSTQDLSQKNSKAAPPQPPQPLPAPQRLPHNAAEMIQELVQRNAVAAFGPLAMQAPGQHHAQQLPQTTPLLQHILHQQQVAAPREEPRHRLPQTSPAFIQDLLQKRAKAKYRRQQEQAGSEQHAKEPSPRNDPKVVQGSSQKGSSTASREPGDRFTSQIRASSTLPAASRAEPATKRGLNTWKVGGVEESNAQLPASGMSTHEFLMRTARAKTSRSREPSSGFPRQTINVDDEDEERRVAAAELESLRGARTASLGSQKRQHPHGSWGGESDDSGLPAAARLLSSWAHQGTSGRKRPYESPPGTVELRKRRGGPGEALVADAAVMAQIGQMRPVAIAQGGQAPHSQAAAATRASPPADTRSPSAEHDKSFLVEQATELVCRALVDGPWPSSSDFSVVVAALHQFSSDIIVPALYAVDPLPTVISDTPIILGTFLMLREALILNADSIFGIMEEEDPTVRRGNQRNSQNDYFSACTLSTSVLLAALDSLDDESSATFTAKFLRLVDAYESGQGDFARLATEIDDDDSDSEPLAVKWPSGTIMEDDVQDAWRTSHKWHMRSHSSVLSQKFGPDVRPMQHNAVHISVIGQQHIEEESTRR